MSHTRYVDDNGNLVTVISDDVTIEEIKKLQDELHSYLHDGEIYELVIHKPGTMMNLDMDDANESADNIRKVMRDINRGAIAFVSDEDLVFGLCRQLQIRVGNDFVQMCVFRSEETALIWLNEMKSSKPAVK